MYPTAFLPFFLVLVLISLRSANAWAACMGAVAFFQAASPILLVAGGRISGIAPAYGLMFVGLWHVYGHLFARRDLDRLRLTGSTETTLLILFALVAIAGALLFPRLFQGIVQVLPPREGLDSGFTYPLKPSGTNYIQAFYIACILMLYATTRYLCAVGVVSRDRIVAGVAIGAAISVSLGFYQVAAFYLGLPWPAAVINSNLGLPHLLDQTALGLKRMSATFLEPSQMSAHFLGALGLVALGLRRKLLGGLLLVALLLSTSSTAYFGLALLLLAWVGFDLTARARVVLPTLLAIIAVVGVAWMLDQSLTDGRLVESLIIGKFDQGSGAARLNADLTALETLVQTFGLGAGVGSARASTLPATLLATTGMPGFLLFAGFVFVVIRRSLRDTSDGGRALSLALIGLLVGWSISVPDVNFPLFWILAASVGAAYPRNRQMASVALPQAGPVIHGARA